MKLHEIETIENTLFRRLRVESGYLYNIWNQPANEWETSLVFVPDPVVESELYKNQKVKDSIMNYVFSKISKGESLDPEFVDIVNKTFQDLV